MLSLHTRFTTFLKSSSPDKSTADTIVTEQEVSQNCNICPLAPKCSGEYKLRGCDGSGKIQGGIATVSFLSWWPIKVFRPCPSYLAAGYVYRREVNMFPFLSQVSFKRLKV